MNDLNLRRRCLLGKVLILGRCIGRGSFGEVYIASRANDATRQGNAKGLAEFPALCAVKIIPRNRVDAGTIAAVRREVSTLRTLDHPSIVKYIAGWLEATPGQFYGSTCLAMKYCAGGDLFTFIDHRLRTQQPLSEELIVRVMTHIFSALNYSHAKRIIHRDIKPANVFLSVDSANNVKSAMVGDFGIARSLDKTLQLARTRVGTLTYISPEIAAAEWYTSKTDIFSAGVIMYELMTLHHPFCIPAFTEQEVLQRIVNFDPIPRLTRLMKGQIDDRLIEVVRRCLSKYETHRPTAFEVLMTLQSPITIFVPSIGIRVWREDDIVNGDDPSFVKPSRRPSGAPAPLPASENRQLLINALCRLLLIEFPSRIDERIMQVLNGDQELFMLLRVLILYNKGDFNHLKIRIARLLHSLRPTIAVREVTQLMSKDTKSARKARRR